MDSYKKLLTGNRRWAESQTRTDPDFFVRSARDQRPEFLWIGCSDSRVPAENITGVRPGEFFVHRNIANLVVHTDLNLLTVLHYAVDFLKVKHIIVCGHYGCGGISAAVNNEHLGILNPWLQHIKDVCETYNDELNSLRGRQARLDRLVELNVITQLNRLARTELIQRNWKLDKRPILHGWVYGIDDGLIRVVDTMTSANSLTKTCRFRIDQTTA